MRSGGAAPVDEIHFEGRFGVRAFRARVCVVVGGALLRKRKVRGRTRRLMTQLQVGEAPNAGWRGSFGPSFFFWLPRMQVPLHVAERPMMGLEQATRLSTLSPGWSAHAHLNFYKPWMLLITSRSSTVFCWKLGIMLVRMALDKTEHRNCTSCCLPVLAVAGQENVGRRLDETPDEMTQGKPSTRTSASRPTPHGGSSG